jgi:hypothetical protein
MTKPNDEWRKNQNSKSPSFWLMGGGLVTLEKAKVIRYQDQGKR